MTKRDYDLIAAVFRTQLYIEQDCNNSDTGTDIVCELARRMASELLNTNPRFNMSKFLKACGTHVEREVD